MQEGEGKEKGKKEGGQKGGIMEKKKTKQEERERKQTAERRLGQDHTSRGTVQKNGTNAGGTGEIIIFMIKKNN